MLAFGRRSSIQPFFAFSTAHGMRIDAPRSEAPQLNSFQRRRLVLAGEPVLDADAVVLHVLLDVLAERLARGDDRVPALAHRLRREVRVRAGAVPVAADRLRVERGAGLEVLGDAVEQPAGHPELVADRGRGEDPDLELPLAHHHLGVGALDREPGVHARLGVRLDDRAADDLGRADAAVVRALRGGEPALGPTERVAVLQEGVLLLDAEDRLLVGVLLGDRRRTRPGCSTGAG